MASEPKIKKFTKNVKIYVQILPTLQECMEDIKILDDKKTLYVRSALDFGKGKTDVIPKYCTFITDGVLQHLTQNDIFDILVKESLNQTMAGIDLLVFAYGQTGTGKSSTLNGLQNNFECRGLVPRMLTELFELQKICKLESTIKFSVSYVEIGATYILDLLKVKGKRILHTPFKDLNVIKIKSQDEGLKLLFQGEGNRCILRNAHVSNKYTSVFTIHIRNISRIISRPVVKISKIHIIDMAGIDIGGSLNCYWKNAREVGIGNLNKMQLEQCLLILQEDVIKSKSSVKDAGILVTYLGKSFGAQSLIKFIAHIRPERKHLGITLSTLHFANIARNIKRAKLKPIVESSPHLQVKQLEHELAELKHQVYLNSMLMNSDLSYNVSKPRVQQMQNAVDSYIKNQITGIELLNVTDANIALDLFKRHSLKLIEEIGEIKKLITKTPSKISLNTTNKENSTLNRIKQDTGPKPPRRQSMKSARSKESQISKKRRSTDKTSKQSKLNIVIPGKITSTGSLIKSGVTLGHLMSYNYEGDVAKSLKLKTKLISKSSIGQIEDVADKISKKSVKLSEMSLPLELGNDFETIWENYKTDENYCFDCLDSELQNVEQEARNTLKELNEQINKFQEQVHSIDLKKSDLLKVQMFKSTNLECSPEDSAKLIDAEEHIALHIIELLQNTIAVKEDLLRLQSEIKININEYHRIKDNIMKDFKEYCINHCKITVPVIDQVLECIEDKICYCKEKLEITEEVQPANVFYKYQKEMKKMQVKKLKKKFHI